MDDFSKFETNDKDHFRVAIFGSARVQENDVVYENVKNLASTLAEAGIDVVTGGGPGLMRAANEGHRSGAEKSKQNVHSIGVGIKLPWEQKFNGGVAYKEEFNIFSRRLDKFMLLSNAVVVAPGGLGTLLELFYTWQLVQVHHVCDTPIILMGDMWKGLLKWIAKSPLKDKYLDELEYKMVYYAKDSKQAMEIIRANYDHFQKDKKNFCLNYEKYKIK